MVFYGISKVFSTENNQQYDTIGAFWDELSEQYGRERLRGLGYHWTPDTIEYVIGLREGIIENTNCAVDLPDVGWMTVHGKTADLSSIYDEIYVNGRLKYEIEMFDNHGECEIWYYFDE